MYVFEIVCVGGGVGGDLPKNCASSEYTYQQIQRGFAVLKLPPMSF